jgi:hypothetical protein
MQIIFSKGLPFRLRLQLICSWLTATPSDQTGEDQVFWAM